VANSSQRWKTVWITGASSGIGRDIVLKLAAEGITVVASARSKEALERLAVLNSNIVPHSVDVTDGDAMRDAVAQIEGRVGQIDLAILNAGVWHPMGARAFDGDKVIQSMDVNYNGIVHALDALLPNMIEHQRGHVALVSSVAGYRGLPKAIAYAPSKAAVISLAETLRHDLDRLGVKISLINPGFVDTPMTEVNEFPMPFIITSEDAANRMIAGLKKGKYEIAFPWQTNLMMKMLRLLPNWLLFWVTRTFMVSKK